MSRRDWDRLMRRAAARHGVFTTADATACAVPSTDLTREIRRGRIRRAHRSVYTVAGAPRSWEQRAMAAVLATGGRGVLCRLAAAHVHRLFEAAPPGTVALLIPRGTQVTVRGTVVHRSTRIPDDDLTAVDGLLVTSIERTICDLASTLRPEQLRAIILHAWRTGRTSPVAIARCEQRLGHACRSAALGDVLDDLDPELARARSSRRRRRTSR